MDQKKIGSFLKELRYEKEIIDGERKSENMDKETKETLQKVADYVDAKKRNYLRKQLD